MKKENDIVKMHKKTHKYMWKNAKIYHAIDIIEKQNYNKEKRMYPTDEEI